VQRYKYINMVQDKIEKYNELKYRGKKVFNYDRKYKDNFTHIWTVKQRHRKKQMKYMEQIEKH